MVAVGQRRRGFPPLRIQQIPLFLGPAAKSLLLLARLASYRRQRLNISCSRLPVKPLFEFHFKEIILTLCRLKMHRVGMYAIVASLMRLRVLGVVFGSSEGDSLSNACLRLQLVFWLLRRPYWVQRQVVRGVVLAAHICLRDVVVSLVCLMHTALRKLWQAVLGLSTIADLIFWHQLLGCEVDTLLLILDLHGRWRVVIILLWLHG